MVRPIASDETFLKSKIEADRAALAVRAWLESLGEIVAMPPQPLRPDQSRRHEFQDRGDLLITSRVEVKTRGFEFTGPDDFPYPSVMVCEDYTLKRHRERGEALPLLWVVTNKSVTAAALIDRSTQRAWTLSTRFDRRQGGERSFWECPKRLCRWKTIAKGEAEASAVEEPK